MINFMFENVETSAHHVFWGLVAKTRVYQVFLLTRLHWGTSHCHIILYLQLHFLKEFFPKTYQFRNIELWTREPSQQRHLNPSHDLRG